MRTDIDNSSCVLFRVDGGGYGVALGHVFRCLRLAKQLSVCQIKSIFCIRTNPQVKSLIESEGHQVVLLEQLPGYSMDAADAAISSFVEQVRGILYIDLRGEKKQLVDMARSKGLPVVVYDDIYEEDVFPNVLINPSECDRALYTGGGVECMLGSRYVILDPDLRSYRKTRFSASIRDVFVCFGGADPCNVTARVVRRVLAGGFSGQITVALGPGYQDSAGIRSLAIEAGNVVLYQGVNFLAPLMSNADVAIASGGTVMCEAIALALPVLILPTISHEVAIAETYKSQGLVASISCDVNDIDDELLGLAVDRFFSSVGGREAVYTAQAAGSKFNGCEAIAEKLRQLLA